MADVFESTTDIALALRRAWENGYSGAHYHSGQGWLPCSTHDQYLKSAFARPARRGDLPINVNDERRKRKLRKGQGWEELGERGVISIETMPGGGLVSGKSGEKSAWAPIDGDSDVFTDIASARRRARQLGCIGVARRTSRSGNTVWTPCTNMTDYQKRTGSTAFGQRWREERELRILRDRLKKIRRGKSLQETISGKRLGGNLRQARIAAQPYDPNAVDGDNDGIVQDGTAFQRPAVPNLPSVGQGFAGSNRRRDRKVRKLERQGRLAREGSVEREVQLMTRRERQGFEDFMRSVEPTLEDLDAEYLDWLTRNPAYADELSAVERAKLPAATRNGFASSNAKGGRIAVGSGGREMSKKILDRVKPVHRDKKGQREFHFVGGTPGSGKSSLVRNGTFKLPPQTDAAHIDPDEIKMGLHGYDGGKGAQAVHSASRMVTDKTMDAANEAGMDIVVQGVGKRTEHLEWARRKGLTTVGHFAHVPGSVADQRIRDREKAGGTVLPRNYGSHMMGYIQASVPRQITSGLYDEFYLWDNTTDTPRLIASRTRDGAYLINDDQAFDEFMGPGARYVRDYWKKSSN